MQLDELKKVRAVLQVAFRSTCHDDLRIDYCEAIGIIDKLIAESDWQPIETAPDNANITHGAREAAEREEAYCLANEAENEDSGK